MTSAIRHCLKVWMIGVYVEPPSATKFKYDSTITMYQWFLATWNAHPRRQGNQREEEDHSHKFTSFYTYNYSEKANSNSYVETNVEAVEHETDNELEEETDDD
ncbi:hypothetical protein BGX38DRAFT_1147504 [Terfezia claveryi]|nr:hypothetical protein BGX38DRAFT_1147504 [Terfezia claveryi]